jgi:hypothetical protein
VVCCLHSDLVRGELPRSCAYSRSRKGSSQTEFGRKKAVGAGTARIDLGEAKLELRALCGRSGPRAQATAWQESHRQRFALPFE